MSKIFLRVAAVLAAITVALGAMGAHKLRGVVSDKAVEIFETAVRYQFYHVIGLALAGILFKEYPNRWIKNAGIFFLLGILLFSGSLYVLTYSTATVSPGFGWAGPITPVGGVMFIVGWCCLAFGIGRKN